MGRHLMLAVVFAQIAITVSLHNLYHVLKLPYSNWQEASYSEWSEWSTECVGPCGFTGYQTRTRVCDDHSPVPEGSELCDRGSLTDIRTCSLPPCIVDGDWATWTAWSGCSVTCGFGFRDRSRTCTNPPPQNGGQCYGPAEEFKVCSNNTCLIEGICQDFDLQKCDQWEFFDFCHLAHVADACPYTCNLCSD